MLWLDALLAYLHFISIFILFAFLAVEVFLIKGPLDARAIRLLGRVDLWYFGASMAVLVTGFLRLGLGAKGADFYLSSWPIYVKVGLFLVVGILSVYPTLAFIRWRRALEHDPQWQLPAQEQASMRRLVMTEIHLAAMIPVFAVIMSRGLGR
jgi:putative membrane protein